MPAAEKIKTCRVMFADTETTGFPFKRVKNGIVFSEVQGVVHIVSICWMIYDVPIGKDGGKPKLISDNYEIVSPGKIWDLTTDSPDMLKPLLNTKGQLIDFRYSLKERQEIIINRLEALKINKFDYDTLLKDGKSPEIVYNAFYKDLEKCDFFVAHNAPFDKNGLDRGFKKYLPQIRRLWPENCTVIDTLAEIKWWENGIHPQAIGEKIPQTFWNKCFLNRRNPSKEKVPKIRKNVFNKGGPCAELNEIYYAVFGSAPDLEMAHDARGDTIVLRDIFFKLWEFVEIDGIVTFKAIEPLPTWTPCVFWPTKNSSGEYNYTVASCKDKATSEQLQQTKTKKGGRKNTKFTMKRRN